MGYALLCLLFCVVPLFLFLFFFTVYLDLQKEGHSFHLSVEGAFLTWIWGHFSRERSDNYSEVWWFTGNGFLFPIFSKPKEPFGKECVLNSFKILVPEVLMTCSVSIITEIHRKKCSVAWWMCWQNLSSRTLGTLILVFTVDEFQEV